MAKQLYTNNAEAIISGSLSSSATTVVLASASGAAFPSLSGGNYFVGTIYELNGSGIEINHEIVKVTARVADSLTIVRAFDNTTARAYPDSPTNNPSQVVYFSLRWTAYAAGNVLTTDDNLASLTSPSTARTSLGLGTIATQDASNVTITGGAISGITDLAVADGGTGSSTAAGARTNLGATTVGANLFTLLNPSAITFPRFNADNTVSTLDAAAFRTAIGAGTGSGTVTSVAELTLGTTGTDLSSTVATGTTTPAITLNVPTASAANRGALSSTDWSTFNGKQAALVSGTNIKTVGGASLLGSGDAGTIGVAYGGTGATTAATARTNLGATTLGANLFTLTNPSALTFPRFNADNTISALDAATFRTAIGAGTGSGTVTSVTGTSPVASSGGTTPAISLASGYGDTQNPYASKTANYVLAAPNGATGVPTFRAIVAADIPTLNQNTTGTAANVTGVVAIANGGTGAATLAAAGIPELSADQTFTGAQRGTVTDNTASLSFNMSTTNNFKTTPTATGALTFTNLVAGQSGYVLLVNTGGYAITAAASTKVNSSFLTTVSVAGTYLLSYFTDGTNVYVTTGGAMA